ncbi:hypothetical protein CNR22_18700 [Sphingobacteriaceae bacterium]|nr:hypothetical protein CNR22_18700 [Sphingobacteriaceae bacterium]
MNRLQNGSFTPNFNYQTHFDNESKEYFTESQNKKSSIFFLRYVGCLACKLDSKRIDDNLSSFRNKNTEVFVVLQSTNESIESYKEVQQINFYGKSISDLPSIDELLQKI